MNWISAFIFGLFVIWTGLLRGIEAQAYKPNSLWFCLVTGLMCIGGAYAFRIGWKWAGLGLTFFAATVVLLFYLWCFISQPEKDATIRVGLVIVASIAQLGILFLPPKKQTSA